MPPVPKTIMVLKISTLNLCLGLPNKKDLVKTMLIKEKIDVLCLQETELPYNLDHSLMSLVDFQYESELNTVRSRVGMYVRSGLKYVRRQDLEGINSHIIVIDVKSDKNFRIITLYRPFNPLGTNPRAFFQSQLDILNNAITPNSIVLGDFNLDWNKRDNPSYQFKNYFNDMDVRLSGKSLTQLIKFPTWRRTVNNQLKESIIDHLYATNPTSIINVSSLEPLFGDHSLISCEINCSQRQPDTYLRRNWKNYNKSNLKEELEKVDWNITDTPVQGFWNSFENKLINVIDKLAPMFDKKSSTKVASVPAYIKNKLNVRKRLLCRFKLRKEIVVKSQIDVLNRELKKYFRDLKAHNVKKVIQPGSTKTLWQAVNIAKDTCNSTLPKTLYDGEAEVHQDEVANAFASYFDNKIKNVLEEVTIDENVYNGRKLVDTSDKFFMTEPEILQCMKTLKNKNSEGFDRVPQRILLDGCAQLSAPLAGLFSRIYEQKSIPDQWKIAKTIPVFKNKGKRSEICNYRPIANLCSTSKIFEKLILKRILEIQDEALVDLTSSSQHGFKRKCGTATLSSILQSQIARAIDDDDFAIMASLDLSSAFDLVNIDLLIRRLHNFGLPDDVIALIKVWLTDRSYYVCVDGTNSMLYDLLLGTVQGSILGPVLYAMFVSPAFDIEPHYAFADDSYILRWKNSLPELICDIEKSLGAITKWLRDSGLKVNQAKTDLCLFNRHDTAPVMITIDGCIVHSKRTINVLGLVFDSKLQWADQVASTINKANRALNAIKIIRRFFSTNELLTLVTSNFYSILFYNSEVWHIPSLNQELKHSLFVASAGALKMCKHYHDPYESYYEIHSTTKRATPEMLCKYKLSLLLYKTFNEQVPEDEWLHLNDNIVLTSRQTKFKCVKNNYFRVGLNCLANRFHYLNDLIPIAWLDAPFNSYKIKCKSLFLSYN